MCVRARAPMYVFVCEREKERNVMLYKEYFKKIKIYLLISQLNPNVICQYMLLKFYSLRYDIVSRTKIVLHIYTRNIYRALVSFRSLSLSLLQYTSP